MNQEEREQLVLDYLLGELTDEARGAFEAQLDRDPLLADMLIRLEETMGSLTLAPPPVPLPASLRHRVLASPLAKAAVPAPARDWWPWAWAAGFAVACVLLISDDQRAHRELATARTALSGAQSERDIAQRELDQARAAVAQNDELRATIAALRDRDTLAQMRIATLSAKLASFAQAGVTIVWDQEKQRGVIQITNLPKLAPNQDYQLWVVDPKYPIPVNGGVVRADNLGGGRVFFAPDQKVDQVDHFAITIERTGGVPKAQGPLVFAGS